MSRLFHSILAAGGHRVSAALLHLHADAMLQGKAILGRNAGVGQVCGQLRSLGHGELARRVSMNDKLQNAAAHPDVALPSDLAAALRAPEIIATSDDGIAGADLGATEYSSWTAMKAVTTIKLSL